MSLVITKERRRTQIFYHQIIEPLRNIVIYLFKDCDIKISSVESGQPTRFETLRI